MSVECNPVNKDPVRLLNRLIKYAAKGYRVAPGMVQEIWEKNQKPPVVMNEKDWSKIIEEALKQNQNQPYPTLMPGNPADIYGKPYTITWTRTADNSGGNYTAEEVADLYQKFYVLDKNK
jgi:hypothetical protein